MVDALAVVDDKDSRTNEGCIEGLAKGKMRVRWWSSADHIWPRAIKELNKLGQPASTSPQWRMEMYCLEYLLPHPHDTSLSRD